MKKPAWSLPLVLIFSTLCWSEAPTGARIAITHVTIIDMTGAASKPDMTVVLEGNHIVSVGRSSQSRLSGREQVIDARGKYLIPGLWDMHIHNFFGPNQIFYSLYIANGITGVRDMGGAPKYYDAMEEIRRDGLPLNGRWPAPRIVAAGMILDGQPPIHPSNLVVTTPQQAREAVDMLKQRGADFIKVYNMLNRPSYFAIAAQAKADGLPFVGHDPFTVSAAEASDAGQKSIEHSDGILLAASTEEAALRQRFLSEVGKDGWSPTMSGVHNRMQAIAIDSYSEEKAAALFARFVRNDTWVCPTLVVESDLLLDQKSPSALALATRYAPRLLRSFWLPAEKRLESVTPQQAADQRKIYSKLVFLVGAMHRAGVRLLAGTDTTNPYLVPGFSLHEELRLLVQAGLRPMEALQTATVNPARFLGEERELGTIQEGKLADLLLLDADPLEDIGNTTRIDAVFANGRYLSKADLRQMLAEVEAAGKVAR